MDGRKVVVGVSSCRRSRSGDVTRYLIRALERSGPFDGVPDDLLTFFFVQSESCTQYMLS